jgi:hypothetical protein
MLECVPQFMWFLSLRFFPIRTKGNLSSVYFESKKSFTTNFFRNLDLGRKSVDNKENGPIFEHEFICVKFKINEQSRFNKFNF